MDNLEDVLAAETAKAEAEMRRTDAAKGNGDGKYHGPDVAAEIIPPKPSRFQPIWLNDIVLSDAPPYLIDGLLPMGPTFMVVFGPPKSLKSFQFLDVFLHIAAGKEYCGRAVQQGVVIYITSEGIAGVERRLIAMRRYHGIEGQQIPFALIRVMPNLGTGTEDLQLLKAEIQKVVDQVGPVRAIAIDTLRRAIPGKSENDQKDMSVFVANCDCLSSTFQCLVGAVHHSPRSDDTRGSGSNSVDGAADCM